MNGHQNPRKFFFTLVSSSEPSLISCKPNNNGMKSVSEPYMVASDSTDTFSEDEEYSDETEEENEEASSEWSSGELGELDELSSGEGSSVNIPPMSDLEITDLEPEIVKPKTPLPPIESDGDIDDDEVIMYTSSSFSDEEDLSSN